MPSLGDNQEGRSAKVTSRVPRMHGADASPSWRSGITPRNLVFQIYGANDSVGDRSDNVGLALERPTVEGENLPFHVVLVSLIAKQIEK